MITSDSAQFDAIVVGSGISGGWAAKELTEKGLRVLVLERGRDIEHGVDYLGEHAPNWKMPYQGKPMRALYEQDYPIQSTSYAFGEATRQYWNNDRDNPYQSDPERPFQWLRADVVGGRSLLWGRQTYRWSEQDFKANAEDGYGVPWPIGYEDLAPWYSHVEKFAGISGEALGLAELPDSEFLPPMEMYALEKTIRGRLRKKAPELNMTIGRAAILTQDHQGRAACHYCGPCERGCSTGSYFSSQSSTLPAATATGRMTLKSNAVVERLVHDPDSGRIVAVEVIDSQTRERSRYSAKVFFLCASTVASTQIMLNSRSEAFPSGLANRSGVLGQNLMDHVMSLASVGMYLDNMDSYYKGHRPNGVYIPRFRNNGDRDEDADFVRGYGYQAHVLRSGWSTRFNSKGFGADYKQGLAEPGYWLWAMAGFGECLPNPENRVTLDPSRVDRFGIPQVSVSFEWGPNEKALWRDVRDQSARIQRAGGAIAFFGDESLTGLGGSAIHEMGTARMGSDPATSVLNAHNQAHDVDNLFVTDGSCMTSSSCVNPSLTYMALTARAADYAARQVQAGVL